MDNSQKPIDQLLTIMAKLRDPNGGCPWDLEQNFASIVPHTIEEAYEVADAIEKDNMQELKEELGDLLLQVVFHAQMAKEEELFTFDDVAQAINTKLIHRHPHVFGEEEIKDAAAQEQSWEKIKQQERERKHQQNNTKPTSILDDIPVNFPALLRAVKLQKKAAKVGFDWPGIEPVFAKIEEEIQELKDAFYHKKDTEAVAEELGDLLFAVCNVARHLKIDPETALRQGNAKFIKRFNYIERALEQLGKSPQDSSLEEMDGLWEESKK